MREGELLNQTSKARSESALESTQLPSKSDQDGKDESTIPSKEHVRDNQSKGSEMDNVHEEASQPPADFEISQGDDTTKQLP